jgi:hypothetical protein
MISIVKYLFEIKEHSGYTKADVKSGYGKLIGGMLGIVPGTVATAATGVPELGTLTSYPGSALGHLISKGGTSEKDKKEPIDERKKSHRFGVITSEGLRAKRVGKYAGIGAGAGAALIAAHRLTGGQDLDPETLGKGAAGGALIASSISQLKGSHEAAKKLGYGKTGRILSVPFGPFVGLTKPKRIKDEENKK